MTIYKCKYCNKEFDNRYKLGGHVNRCKLNPNYKDNLIHCCNFKEYDHSKSEYNKDKECHCKYCNKLLKNENSLKQHELRCKENPNHKQYELYEHNLMIHNNETEIWNKNKTGKDNISIKNHIINLKKYYESHDGPNKGLIMTEEDKLKRRIGFLNYVKEIKHEFHPQYNKKCCKYIDNLNEQNNWNLQHAENGGEIEIDGYFLDGYDKDLNIVFEYDEKQHYKDVFNNILKDKDIQRQNNIINKLNCKFYRYNEYMNLLYEVN